MGVQLASALHLRRAHRYFLRLQVRQWRCVHSRRLQELRRRLRSLRERRLTMYQLVLRCRLRMRRLKRRRMVVLYHMVVVVGVVLAQGVVEVLVVTVMVVVVVGFVDARRLVWGGVALVVRLVVK